MKCQQSGRKLYFCTTGKLDGVYLPCGYTFAERIIGMNDFMGIKAAFVLKQEPETYGSSAPAPVVS